MEDQSIDIRSIEDFEQFVNQLIIDTLKRPDEIQRKLRLQKATKVMATEYATDKELTAFTALVSIFASKGRLLCSSD